MASDLDAHIYLVRVVVWVDAFSGLRFDPDILRMIENAKIYLCELASRFELPPDRTVPLVRYGHNAAKEIITVAENEGIDLVILVSRCKGWFRRVAQGSVCSEVVRSRVCPVLCVPPARGELGHQRRGVLVRRC